MPTYTNCINALVTNTAIFCLAVKGVISQLKEAAKSGTCYQIEVLKV